MPKTKKTEPVEFDLTEAEHWRPCGHWSCQRMTKVLIVRDDKALALCDDHVDSAGEPTEAWTVGALDALS